MPGRDPRPRSDAAEAVPRSSQGGKPEVPQADAYRGLAKAIDNLLSNAIKFTFEKGKVDIIIEPHKTNEIAVSVKDTGMGIPEQNIKYLFETEEGFDRGEDGMGTGLTIVQKILDKHGATMEINSELGKGTCFKLIFPKGN